MAKPKSAGGLGFKDVEFFNNALLTKLSWPLSWHVFSNPDSLLSQVLLGKYCLDSSFLEAQSAPSSSHGWRSILTGKEVLAKSLGWIIGNGESIQVLHDPWLDPGRQVTPIGPPSSDSYHLKVADLLDPSSNEWNLAKINRTFQLTPLSGPPLVRLGEKSGRYSIRSGYIEHREGLVPVLYPNWYHLIWNVPTSSKIRQFLWKAANGALPVGASLMLIEASPSTTKTVSLKKPKHDRTSYIWSVFRKINSGLVCEDITKLHPPEKARHIVLQSEYNERQNEEYKNLSRNDKQK